MENPEEWGVLVNLLKNIGSIKSCFLFYFFIFLLKKNHPPYICRSQNFQNKHAKVNRSIDIRLGIDK